MRFTTPSGLVAVVASMAAVVSADDNATSVPTSVFKSRFVESGIVPEVIAALDPSVSFYASYKADDGHDELIIPGTSMTVNEAQLPFEFAVENINNASNITASTRFLIYLLDADAPSRNSPTARNLRHYLQGNFTLSSARSTVLPTATRLFVPANQNLPFTRFQQPQPRPNSGTHRFIYALYTQPARYNNAGFESAGMEAKLENWELPRWRMQLGLGPAIGATFFLIDTEANGGNGTTAGSVRQVPGAMMGLGAMAAALGLGAFL